MRSSSRVAVALAAAAVLAGGCSSDHSTKVSGASPVVAWQDAVPELLQVGSVVPARPCRVSQLRVVGNGFFLQPAGNGGRGSAELRNAGRAPCRLTGRPTVRFVGAPLAPRQRQIDLPARPPEFPSIVPPESSLLALAPGAVAAISIDWSNWCVPGATRATKALVPPRAVRVTLAGGRGSIDVNYNAVTPCITPDRPSTIGVRPFQRAPLPPTKPWTLVPLKARVLTLSGRAAPVRGRRGDLVRFAVELRNVSKTETLRFGSCPILVELLAPAGKPEVHTLNCAGAHPVAPGRSLRFEMRIQVPTDAPTGPNGLFWELDPLGSQQPEIVARLVVAP